MARPSDPLLTWLRKLMDARDMNTASVAERSGIPRARLRKVLAGGEPMLVDELMTLSKALDISPADMGLADAGMIDDEPTPSGEPTLEVAPDAETELEEELRIDPWGNHLEQLFRVAFRLGCDFFFLARADELGDSGVPGQVLRQYRGRDLPIKLDAVYHQYNQPRYDDRGVTLTLSFDQLHDCTFPWKAIHQVIFFPEPPSEGDDGDDGSPDVPHLRLVT